MREPVSASIVVASHARPHRLRWLLNALEEQTFAEPWEAVVVHDYDPETAARVLDRHPLSARGRLRHIAIAPGTGSPARQPLSADALQVPGDSTSGRIAGEDVDLSLRARATGVEIRPAPEAVVNHAIESHTLPGILRQNLKWRYLAYLVKHRPGRRPTAKARVGAVSPGPDRHP